MSYQNPLSSDEQFAIENELEILFACQGKNLSKEMRSIWISEIDKSTIPTKAILQGLTFLKTEDLQAIKLNIVFSAARRYTEFEQVKNCGNCLSGYVPMKDDAGRIFSTQCQCAAGHSKANQGLVLWGGGSTQYSNGRMLSVCDRA